jgi:transcriptional regulator with XRE-family HTH domain
MSEDAFDRLGRRLRGLRAELGLKQSVLAEHANCPLTAVQLVERGQGGRVKSIHLFSIAEVLGHPLAEAVTARGER